MLNAGDLEDRILELLTTEYAAAHQHDMTGAQVVQTPQEDGTVKSEITFQYGSPSFDPEDTRPLARAIAQAVVEHIGSHAEVTGTGVGADWRIE